MADKVAFVTGAGSGIGRAAAVALQNAGFDVALAGRRAAQLEETAAMASGDGGKMLAVPTDVGDVESVRAAFAKTKEAFGRLDVLFNNAGVLINGTSWLCSAEDWRWNFDVNIMGIVHGIRSFVPRMLNQGQPGRVINTGSIGGLLGGGPYMGIYQGTKHAIVAITESLHNELSMEDAPVTASVLCPGEVATGIGDPERLRSGEGQKRSKSTAEQQFHNALSQGIAAGLAPDEFAGRVFDAIAEDKFWLLPQPEFKPMVQLRTQSIIDETVPPNLTELMGDW